MTKDSRTDAAVQEPGCSFLTAEDIRRELRISEKLAYKLLQDGTIPSVRVGRMYRVPRQSFEETMLANHKIGAR